MGTRKRAVNTGTWAAAVVVGLGTVGCGSAGESAPRPGAVAPVGARVGPGAERREPLPSLEEERYARFRRENAQFAREKGLEEQVGEVAHRWNDPGVREADGRLVLVASASGPTLREAYDAAVVEGQRRLYRERGVRGADCTVAGGRYARLSVGGVQVWVQVEAPARRPEAATHRAPEAGSAEPLPPSWWLAEPIRTAGGLVTVTAAADGPGLREALRGAVDAASELARREAGAAADAPVEVVQSGSIRLPDGTYRAFVMVRAESPG